jgi:hypothetical protein
VRWSPACEDVSREAEGTSAVGSNVTENTGLCVGVSCDIVPGQRGRKLRSRHQATPSEDKEDLGCAVMVSYARKPVNTL